MATKSEIQSWQRLVGANPDGDPGPKTFEATVSFLAQRGYIERDPLPAVSVLTGYADVPIYDREPRARVVAIALGELGPGGTAKVQDPQRYIGDAAPIYRGLAPNAKAWCGIFWLWCLREAGLVDKTWVDGRGFAQGYLPTVSIPEPGDGMYFGKPNHHYEVVRYVRDGYVYTVGGNTLSAPLEGVSPGRYPINAVAAGGGCYFSIRNLVLDARIREGSR